MNIRKHLLFALLSLSILTACKKENKGEAAPDIQMSVTEKTITAGINETITIEAVNKNSSSIAHEWQLNGTIVSTEAIFKYVVPKSGSYTVTYKATNAAGSFTYEYIINVDMVIVPVTPNSKAYVSTMFEFLPAPGQNTNKTLGTIDAAKSLEGKQGMVSLGAWGGYIVLGFDHTVINEANKEDIIVYGNPYSNFAEPGIIWVMRDENGNGKPDDTWYELKGSEFGNAGYVRDYEVTYTKPAVGGNVSWKDNKGASGTVNISSASFQAYPAWLTTNEYTLKGSILPTTGIKPGGIVTSNPFAFGYADNTVNGDKIDIANAVDKDGKVLSLGGIDFIKIQTGIQANLGVLGELSTEVVGVADLSLLK